MSGTVVNCADVHCNCMLEVENIENTPLLLHRTVASDSRRLMGACPTQDTIKGQIIVAATTQVCLTSLRTQCAHFI